MDKVQKSINLECYFILLKTGLIYLFVVHLTMLPVTSDCIASDDWMIMNCGRELISDIPSGAKLRKTSG
jgi:hypothetical protein